MMDTREMLVRRLDDVCYNETAITMEMKVNPDMGFGMSLDVVLRDVSNDENIIYIDVDNGSFSIDATNVEYDDTVNSFTCYGDDNNVIFEFLF